MCGILGAWWKFSPGDIDEKMRGALSLLRFRGPDHQDYKVIDTTVGKLAVGHTRLSIIDLSEAANQPMGTPDGRYSIVFNGEIYNYKELREELKTLGHVFSTASDTEVLLSSWSQWGERCLTRLIGMFAFVVYDRVDESLTCVRDAFGIKPLFFSIDDRSFLFASELPALLRISGQSPQPNWQKAYDYVVHGHYDSGDQTFVAGVSQLPPGHLIEFDLREGKLVERRHWWKPSVEQTSSLSFEEAANTLRNLFLDSVRMHLRSDVPLGAALSGGVDSSALVCAIRHIEPETPIHTFSYIATGSEVSEEVWVDRVNHHAGATPHKVTLSKDELLADLDEMISAQGEPFGSTSIYAQYRVFKLARDSGVKVVLDGQGADEMLAGYIGYPGHRIMSLVERGRLLAAAKFSSLWKRWPGRSNSAWTYFLGLILPDRIYLAARRFAGRAAEPQWVDREFLRKAGVDLTKPRYPIDRINRGRRVMEALAFHLTKFGLPHLLRHEDRNAMHFSVESRVPFLTIPMAEFLLSLPEEFLISPSGETKSIFRAAMRGIVPDDVLDRRDKIGFATPEKTWILESTARVRSILERSQSIPLFHRQPLLDAFDRVVSGKSAFGWHVWRWVNFIIWYERMIIGSHRTD